MFFKILSRNNHIFTNRINNFCTTSKHLFETHYEVLQLKRDCTSKDIKDAFIKLSKQHHPDATNTKESQKRFVRILEAYNVLSKPNLRRNYDLGLLRPTSRIQTDSPNPYYDDSHYERATRDPSFWEYRDKTQDKFYKDGYYYGIKGVPRVSNKIIVFVCIIFTAIGVALQVILIRFACDVDRKSVTLKRDHMIQKSIEAENALKTVRHDAVKYGNEIQIQRLKERIERNNLAQRLPVTPREH